MKRLMCPELPTAAVRSSQATLAAVDNFASFVNRPQSTYKSGKVVQTNGTTSASQDPDSECKAQWELPIYLDEGPAAATVEPACKPGRRAIAAPLAAHTDRRLIAGCPAFGASRCVRRVLTVYGQATKEVQLQGICLKGFALRRTITAPIKYSKSDCLVLPARRQ